MFSFLEQNGFVVAVYNGAPFGMPIEEATYKTIVEAMSVKPSAPSGHDYFLRADTLEWELVELPSMPEPELTDEEVLSIILGGGEA